MFNMGFSELIVLGILALIFIGPKQLPEMAKVVARMLNEFKRATGDLTATLTDVKKKTNEYMQAPERIFHEQIGSEFEKFKDGIGKHQGGDEDHPFHVDNIDVGENLNKSNQEDGSGIPNPVSPESSHLVTQNSSGEADKDSITRVKPTPKVKSKS